VLPLDERGGVNLGRDVYSGQSIIHADQDRDFKSGSGIYILGTRGSGKTSLFLHLILHDINRGRGLALLDPHGILVDNLVARLPADRLSDVIYWDVSDPQYAFGVNPYSCAKLEDDDLAANLILSLFAKLWDVSRTGTPRLRTYIVSSAQVLLANPGMTMLELRDLFTDEAVCNTLLERVTHKPTRDFWQDFYRNNSPNVRRGIVDPLLTRLQEFIATRLAYYMVGQSESALDFRSIIDQRQILLIKLPEGGIGDEQKHVLGTMIIGQIVAAALSQYDIPVLEARTPFHLYVDEFDEFTTPDFSKIINKARQYGLEAIVAHQSFFQLNEEIKASVKTSGVRVVFTIGPDDHREAAGMFEPVEIEVQEGWEPVPVPHPDVVKHLAQQYTHAGALVVRFIREDLAPIFEGSQGREPSPWCQNLRDALNDYFEARMSGHTHEAASHLLYKQHPAVRRHLGIRAVLWNAFDAVGNNALWTFYRNPGDLEVRTDVQAKMIRLEPSEGFHVSGYYKTAQEFLLTLRAVGDILYERPITVDTHERRPKMVRRKTTRAELGALLAAQPPFHAMCRIAGEQGVAQHQIVTENAYALYLPSDPDAVREVARARSEMLRRVVRERGYAKPRSLVDREIEDRQVRLRGERQERPDVQPVNEPMAVTQQPARGPQRRARRVRGGEAPDDD
jgi:hypothetical protein